MSIKQKQEYNFNTDISENEYVVINKFLEFYRNQEVIIADEYRQDYKLVPLEETGAVFKVNDDTFKALSFCKRIFYKGKPYVVELKLSRFGHSKDDPKCLQMRELRITTTGEVHFITLDTEDARKCNMLFNIISIFNENKIISPEKAYSEQMYTDKTLQEFIRNHEWKSIYTGIKQMPELADALFIISEGFHYTAYFGTILYQLISFRINNLNDLDEDDLRELDTLIFNLSKNRLLKVKFHETIGNGVKSYPTRSILLRYYHSNGRVHNSCQYTVDNAELLKEQRVLNKCVRDLTSNNK